MTCDKAPPRAPPPGRQIIEGLWILRHYAFPTLSPSLICRSFYRTLLDNTPFVHTNSACRQIQLIKIAIIVRDHDDCRAGAHEIRQQLFVEFPPEFRILFGCPFIKQKDRTLFEQADNEREPPALSARKFERTKLAVSQAGLVSQPEQRQQAIDLAWLWIPYPIEPPEQMIIEENRR